MTLLRSTLLACAVFAVLAPAAVLFWTIVLGPGMERVWPRLPDGWRAPVGTALLAVAVLSGLGAYFLALARTLGSRLELSGAALALHLATAGLVPLVAAAIVVWIAIATMRIGW
ncbi:MAG TPA: hypothetical protein VEB43_01600 [Anaeromyxobacter sp.]|nr:hypothetical protein [Anaeromyxobacter sp.]